MCPLQNGRLNRSRTNASEPKVRQEGFLVWVCARSTLETQLQNSPHRWVQCNLPYVESEPGCLESDERKVFVAIKWHFPAIWVMKWDWFMAKWTEMESDSLLVQNQVLHYFMTIELKCLIYCYPCIVQHHVSWSYLFVSQMQLYSRVVYDVNCGQSTICMYSENTSHKCDSIILWDKWLIHTYNHDMFDCISRLLLDVFRLWRLPVARCQFAARSMPTARQGEEAVPEWEREADLCPNGWCRRHCVWQGLCHHVFRGIWQHLKMI